MKVYDERLPIKAWVDGLKPVEGNVAGVFVEDEAFQQAVNLVQLPFLYKWLALMPDVHAGYGSTVGSVIATDKAIIPSAVGVDIGCGMCAVQTSLKANDLPEDLKKIRLQIERDIPVGQNKYRDKNLPTLSENCWRHLSLEYLNILDKHPKIGTKDSPVYQIGTLGTGNHFIEICLDTEDNVWIMLHSGSRGIGNNIGRYFMTKAREEMEKYFINLPDKDLAYLVEGTSLFDDYVEAVSWAQNYAMQNRKVMLDHTIAALQRYTKEFTLINEAINCHHNYVQKENHFDKNVFITRKGAVSAGKGQLGIIPGSMGTRSYIVEGLGNKDSFCSCSHGAGRTMSRTKAKNTFTVEDHIKATEGVECRKDKDVIDETPMAYKDIDLVMEAQKDLVKPVAVLKQILCVKG